MNVQFGNGTVFTQPVSAGSSNAVWTNVGPVTNFIINYSQPPIEEGDEFRQEVLRKTLANTETASEKKAKEDALSSQTWTYTYGNSPTIYTYGEVTTNAYYAQ